MADNWIKIETENIGTHYYTGKTSKSAFQAFRQSNPGEVTVTGVADISASEVPEKYRSMVGDTSGDVTAEDVRDSVGGQPQTESDVDDYLDSLQDTIKSAQEGMEEPEIEIPTPEELRSRFTPEDGFPEAIDYSEEYAELREDKGIPELEQELNQLNAVEDELTSTLREQRTAAREEPVAMNVIEGRIGEQERQMMERLDQVTRQKERLVDDLNTRYRVVDQMMKFERMEYDDAVQKYQAEYQQNLNIYNTINEMKGMKIEQVKRKKQEAKANLQTYANAITSGNLSYNDLSSDQKLLVNKLEVKSGLPVGFVSNLKMNPKDKIMFTNSYQGQTQVGVMGEDGNIRMETYGTRYAGGSGDGAQWEVEQDASESMYKTLREAGGDDYYVSPEEWNAAKDRWMAKGYEADEFDEQFRSTYVNEGYYRFDDYNLEESETQSVYGGY